MEQLLTGIGASLGEATGKVKLVEKQEDFAKVEEGDILVTEITDPSMTPIINKVSAIVCDQGGLTSHPSIIARELGIPAVVGTKDATKILKDGSKIKVDGNNGTVYRC